MKNITLLKLGVTLALLAYIFLYVVDIPKTAEILGSVVWRYYVLAYLLSLFGVFVCTKRWQLVLSLKGAALPYLRLLRLYLIGVFYNSFFPGTVGGDLVKMVKVRSEGQNKAALSSSVVVERLFGLAAVYLIAVVVLIINYKSMDWRILRVALITVCIVTAGIVLLVFRKTAERLIAAVLGMFNWTRTLWQKTERYYAALYSMTDFRAARLLNVFALSFIFFLVSYVGPVYFLLRALETPVNYFFLLGFLPIQNLIVMLPVSFGGVGVRELLYIHFLGTAGISPEIAVSLGVLTLSFRLINSIPGAVASVVR